MTTLRLRISPTAEWKLRSGHPWLYDESISQQNRRGETGELAVIYDRHDNFLAIGLYDAESPLRVRVLHKGKPQPLNSDWWDRKFRQALALRQNLFGPDTNAYRCIHGESDGFPGLVLDRYAGTFVLKLYTRAWFPWLDHVLTPLRAQLHPESLVLRLSRNVQQSLAKASLWHDGQILQGGPLDAPVCFLESGLAFEAGVIRGQKTGFFLDQRENRRAVEALAEGRHVLNAFSFSGGFSLYAARGGALSATDLDLSPHALVSARRNFELNLAIPAVARCRHELVQADAFQWLAEQAEPRYNLVILDPPSLAKKQSDRPAALSGYEKLVRHGIRCLSPGGILVAASCSAHVPPEDFFQLVLRTVQAGAKSYRKLQTTLQPADHPANFAEAKYLKCIYIEVLG